MKYLVQSNTDVLTILGELAYIGKQAEIVGDSLLKEVVFSLLLHEYLRKQGGITVSWESDDPLGGWPGAVEEDRVYIEVDTMPGHAVGADVMKMSPAVAIALAKSAGFVNKNAYKRILDIDPDGSTSEQLWGVISGLVSLEHVVKCLGVFKKPRSKTRLVIKMNVLQNEPIDDGDVWHWI